MDSKIDYPAACNAVEKVLVHKSLLESGGLAKLQGALEAAGVKVCCVRQGIMIGSLCLHILQLLSCSMTWWYRSTGVATLMLHSSHLDWVLF